MNKYPVDTQLLHTFLKENEFKAVKITEDYTEWQKAGLLVRVPYVKSLSQIQVEDVLDTISIKPEEFERFIEQSQIDGLFNFIVDKSLHTPPIKKKR